MFPSFKRGFRGFRFQFSFRALIVFVTVSALMIGTGVYVIRARRLHETKVARQRLIEQCLQQMTEESGPGTAISFYHLQQLGPEAKATVPEVTMALTKLLEHENSYHRIQAAFTLWKVDRQRKMIPFLVELLADQDIEARLRVMAAEYLGAMGPEAKVAVPALTEAIQQPDAQLRVVAAWALWKVHGQPDMVKPIFMEALQDKHGNVFSSAAFALGEIGLDKASISALVDALTADPERSFSAERVVPALAKALKDNDAEVRKAAISALVLMPDSDGPTLLALREALQDPDRHVRMRAAERLKEIEESDRRRFR